MHLIIISGRSGAGKSTALHQLEDEGFYCIDNLPVSLLPALVQETSRQQMESVDMIVTAVNEMSVAIKEVAQNAQLTASEISRMRIAVSPRKRCVVSIGLKPRPCACPVRSSVHCQPSHRLGMASSQKTSGFMIWRLNVRRAG